jgi:hypothetical protein
MAGIGRTPCRTMVAEDIRNLQRRARHARPASGGWLGRLGRLDGFEEMIERAHDLADRVGGDARIERRGVELGVSQQS